MIGLLLNCPFEQLDSSERLLVAEQLLRGHQYQLHRAFPRKKCLCGAQKFIHIARTGKFLSGTLQGPNSIVVVPGRHRPAGSFKKLPQMIF